MPPQVRTILVPVDFSPGSDAAVEWAQALAGAFHARLALAHLLFGSVAEHVVRHAPVPVFTVRARAAA